MLISKSEPTCAWTRLFLARASPDGVRFWLSDAPEASFHGVKGLAEDLKSTFWLLETLELKRTWSGAVVALETVVVSLCLSINDGHRDFECGSLDSILIFGAYLSLL